MKLFILCFIFAVLMDESIGIERPQVAILELQDKLVKLNVDVWESIKMYHRENAPYVKVRNAAAESYKDLALELQKWLPNDINEGLESIQHYRLWMNVYSELRPISTLYEHFKKLLFLDGEPPMLREQRLEFSQTITQDFANYKYLKDTVPNMMKNIQEFIVEKNVFKNILQHITFEYCDLQQSTNQIVYILYNSIAQIQFKAFMMSEFAYIMLTGYNKGYKIMEYHNTTKEYQQYSSELRVKAKEALELSNTEIWKCDPKQHKEGETYTQLTELLQGYLENEVDMNTRSNCLQNCAYYDYTQHTGCYRGICKQQQICKGKIVHCRYIDSDMNVCQADRNSGRRYEYIEYDNNRIFGRNTGCKKGVTRVESWWRWLFWHCSYCICLCDDPNPNSDRFFSLRPVVSDTTKNMVVTGVRFQKINRVIHLQIEQGKLLPYGSINSSTITWQPVDAFSIEDPAVKRGEDYHMLLYEKRDIDLDDLIAEKEYVVTGVKFRLVGTHINFEIQVSPFNFTTGELRDPSIKSYWLSSDSTLTRTELQLINPDIPIRTQLPSKLDSESDMFLKFTNSDLERDVGQNTVPYLDTQDVISETAVPLSGVGIYHKGQPNFGGFIAPKIFTYDFSNYI